LIDVVIGSDAFIAFELIGALLAVKQSCGTEDTL